ncbi:TetR family transcriptional regulator [Lysinibacter cavernae]|uniref:AcrR family transcriptional regulator n=1 Tax=Lysinibacter cavernae TaxID=1640652 RepID=A0A7X5R2X2_9MICO|nr:AcrR family transcriptional regulator [Lysinibacter cavernae]
MEQTQPTLTERRRAATELEIATAAAHLFTEHGAAETSAEDIAERAGVSLRTFYRYFPNKHEAVAPFFSSGATHWQQAIAESTPGMSPLESVEQAIRNELSPTSHNEAIDFARTRALLRVTLADPELRRVWMIVNQESEVALLPVITSITADDSDPLSLRLLAAAATDAIRIALESWALQESSSAAPPLELALTSFGRLTAGIPELHAAK